MQLATLKLAELKQYAAEIGATPLGSKSLKQTWIDAIEAAHAAIAFTSAQIEAAQQALATLAGQVVEVAATVTEAAAPHIKRTVSLLWTSVLVIIALATIGFEAWKNRTELQERFFGWANLLREMGDATVQVNITEPFQAHRDRINEMARAAK